jgi:hypothetical protein
MIQNMLTAMRNYFNAFAGLVAVGLLALLSGCASQNLAFEEIQDGLCSNEQSQLIEKHISGQINALSDQNWKKAYGYAAPSFREVVPIQRFEEIIQNEYEMIINNDGFKFTACSIAENKFNQVVVLTSKGNEFKLLYRLTYESGRLGVEAATAEAAEAKVLT